MDQLNEVKKLIGRKFTYQDEERVHIVKNVKYNCETLYTLEDEEGMFWNYNTVNQFHKSFFNFESETEYNADKLIERIRDAYPVEEGCSYNDTHISNLLIDIVKFIKNSV